MPSIRNVGHATDPRNSRSLPISTILLIMSFKFPATVISSTGNAGSPLNPDAASAPREVAGHEVDAEAEELCEEQTFFNVSDNLFLVLVPG